jgi:predicted TPR repeat methyltransferase
MSDGDQLSRARGLRSVDEAAALYRDWAADYDRDVFERSGVIGSARIADLLAAALDDRATRVVDLGCGTGAVGVRLAEHGFSHLVGYDLSPEMLDVAAAKGVYERLRVADLNDTTLPERERDAIGACVSAGTFTHGHVGAGAVPHLVRLLAPGARIAWVVARDLWPSFADALAGCGVIVVSTELEPIRRDADDLAHMVLARLP